MEPSETDSSVEQPNPAPVPVEKSAVEELTAEEPPSKPTETAPPANAPSHWNTGEVAVQVHRPTQKKKPWIQAPGDVEQAPVPPIPAPALEALSETLSAAIREWKSAPVEAAASAVPEEIVPPREEIRPDWMQASDAITSMRRRRHRQRQSPGAIHLLCQHGKVRSLPILLRRRQWMCSFHLAVPTSM